jgi:rubrerythrin
LFRALAKSEGLHADHHAAMIKKMGVEAKAAVAKPDVKSTKENLEVAEKSALAEKDTVYPALLKQIEAEKDAAGAAMSFKGGIAVADQNAKFCQVALKELDGWKAAGKEFLVCDVCSYVTMDQKIEKCPICAAPRSKFEVVK